MTDKESIKRWLMLEGATMQLYQQIPKLRTKKERAELAEAAYSLAGVLMDYHGYISKNMTRDEIVSTCMRFPWRFLKTGSMTEARNDPERKDTETH